MYKKIQFDLNKFLSDKKGEKGARYEKFKIQTIMDVSIYFTEDSLLKIPNPDEKSTNIRKKLLNAIDKKLFHEEVRRVPKFHNEKGLNLVDINYLIKEKELLMNSDINEPKNNFIDVDHVVGADKKNKRFKYVKDKSSSQHALLIECQKRLRINEKS